LDATGPAGSAREQAQRRVDAIAAFQAELSRLEAEQILVLTDAQRGAIATHQQQQIAKLSREFDVDRDVRARQLSLGMRTASLLGALALAASVFFLFHQYWGRLATTAQVMVLACGSAASLVATIWIRDRDGAGYFAKLAALVAFACFVLNIAMFARIFNIAPSDKALLAWGAMAVLLAYACDLRLLLGAGLLCVIGFLSARVGEWNGMYWLDLGQRPENFFPSAALMFVVPLWVSQNRFTGFASTYRIVGVLAVFLPMLALSFWGKGSYLNWDPITIEHCYQVLGFIVGAGAIWLGTRKRWTETINTGLIFFIIFLYTKFYDWWWESLPKYLFFLLLGLTALLVLVILRRVRATAATDGEAV
jgi:uncharacterized membrane protein